MKLLLVGDLILDEPHPEVLFKATEPILSKADLLIGHVEVPHTRTGMEQFFDVPAPPADPDHLKALQSVGFHGVTLAGNHFYDAGPQGVLDTITSLESLGIQSTGAGMNLNDARRPAVFTRGNVKIGLLSYNCVGPTASWANEKKAGVAYVRVISHYEMNHANPGGPPEVFTFAEPQTLEMMQRDIADLKNEVNCVVVSLHKGLVHTPAEIAMYEKQCAKAAIDSGADVVVGQHAHILKGIEFYKGKPIFHGLGNFVTVTRALNADENSSPQRMEWAQKRSKLFGFERMVDYPNYPFHPQSRNAMIARIDFGEYGKGNIGFVPCWIKPDGSPHPVAVQSDKGKEVVKYVEEITRAAGFKTQFIASENDPYFVQVVPENAER